MKKIFNNFLKLIFSSLLVNLIIINNSDVVIGVQILMWSGQSWSGYGSTDFKTPNYIGQHITKEKCPVECKFLDKREMVGDADAVLFEAQPFASWSYTFLKQPPELPQKEVGQLFVNFGYEHEKYFPIAGHHGYQRQIDVNSTFRGTDQVQVTFTCSWGSGENGNINNFLREPLSWDAKKGLVGFMSTNCHGGGAIYRTCYIKEMMKHMQVDALGECMNNKALDPEDAPHAVFADLGDSMRIKERVLSKYKFSLAFENNNITDYVTEKVYTSLLSGSVPIYMGAPNIDEWVPKKSIIKTDDFNSPKELVEYILYLSNNETAYNEYFEWKKHPYPPSFVEKYHNCIFYSGDCKLCQYVDKEIKRMNISNEFRNSYGEPIEDFKQTRVLSIDKDSCVSIKQDITYVPTFKDKLTVMFWLNVKNINEEKVIFSIEANKLVISITTIWKRYFMKVCIGKKCFLGESPIQNDDWRHIAVSVGPATSNDLDHLDDLNNNNNNNKIDSDHLPLTIKLYVDGLLDSSSTTYLDLKFSTVDLNLGCTTIVAKMDDLSIWSTNLDELEIGHAMFKKYQGNEPGHLLYLTFNSETIKDYSQYNRYTSISYVNTVNEISTHKNLVLKV